MRRADTGDGAGAVYLDAAGSEPLHPAAAEVLAAALVRGYADPRRLHGPGRDARLLLDNAREVTAAALAVRPDEVSFTGSGTEAVHRGLLGLVKSAGPAGATPVAASAVEHSCVTHALAWAGHPTATLAVDRLGRVDPESARRAVAEGARVVALQSANHEVGTLQQVTDVSDALDGVPLFMDACASAGRLPLPAGWSVAAASAHKWGGPPGVGVLVVRKGTRWRNAFPADDRIDERSAGFENVPGALAAAAALQAVVAERDERNTRQHRLVERIRRGVAATVTDVEVVGDPDERLPHLVTFSCLYVDGEALVTELDRRGFGIASGSACTASTLVPSHVMAAMGALTHGNVRLSLARDTTAAEVDQFLAVLPDVVTTLRAGITW